MKLAVSITAANSSIFWLGMAFGATRCTRGNEGVRSARGGSASGIIWLDGVRAHLRHPDRLAFLDRCP